MDTQQLVVTAVFVALFALGAVAYRQVRPLIRHKVGEAEFDRLVAQAEVQVHRLEQIGARLGYDGAKKKQLAKVFLTQFAAAVGIKAGEELIDDIIEAAVFTTKISQGTDLELREVKGA